MNPRDLDADCDSCPLSGQLPWTPVQTPSRLTILAEHPVDSTSLFSMKVQRQFALAQREAGVLDPCVTATTLCSMPEDVEPAIAAKAIRCCAPRLGTELGTDRVVFAAGKTAFIAAGGARDGFNSWRGAVQKLGANTVIGFDAVPDALVYRPHNAHAFKRILQRAQSIASGLRSEWVWPKRVLYPGAEALAVLNRIRSRGQLVGVDIENRRDGTITAIGIADAVEGVCLPWTPYRAMGQAVRGITEYPLGPECQTALISLLESDHPKALQNGTHDQRYLAMNGIALGGYVEDTLFRSVTENHRAPHDLQYIVAQEFPVDPWKARFHGGVSDDMNDLPEEDLRWYCLCDCYATVHLAEVQRARAHQVHQGDERHAEYLRKDQVALRMRQQGIAIDREAVLEHERNAIRDRYWAAGLASLISEEAGFYDRVLAKRIASQKKRSRVVWTIELVKEREPFNPGSGPHVAQILYQCFGLEVRRRTKKGAPSTDDKALAECIEQGGRIKAFCLAILAYRQWDKILGTYIDNMPMVRLHPIFKPQGAITGRWAAGMESSDDKGFSIQTIPRALRNCFIADPGYWLLCADYSQLELRIIALLAGDEPLLNAYGTGADVHRLNAAILFSKPAAEISKRERNLAKTLVYAMNYGANPDSIWERLRAEGVYVSLEFVRTVHQRWYGAHPAIGTWQQQTLAQARKDMFIELPFSKRRIFYFGDPRELAITDTSNHPVQGTGADIMDPAFVRIGEILKTTERQIVIHAHDEVVMHTNRPYLDAQLAHEHMVQRWEYGGHAMTFEIELKIGRNWRDQKDITLEELRGWA